MIYNFYHNSFWGKGGIEYAQAYRAKIFRALGMEAKFIITDMRPGYSFHNRVKEIGFFDQEILWINEFFSDCRSASVSYTLEQLETPFEAGNYESSRYDNRVIYHFLETDIYHIAYLERNDCDYVYKVEMISEGCLLRSDYYTYCKIYSEYYAPVNGYAHLYQRRFFNENGTTAFEEIQDNTSSVYRFQDAVYYSKEELVGYMLSCLKLTEKDILLIDGGAAVTDLTAAIIRYGNPAKIGFVIHSEHFMENGEERQHIFWNPNYEYVFTNSERIGFFVVSTEAQKRLLLSQFQRYQGTQPRVETIPVRGLDKWRIPGNERKKHALITASRLSPEKHIDWVIKAVALAREKISNLSLDIYGSGPENEKLKREIESRNCNDCIKLCGHQQLDGIYQNYEAYISGSVGETFGITLLEAAGSGLPLIGLDVRYGNQIFIDDEVNGYKVPWNTKLKEESIVQKLAECIVRLFSESDWKTFSLRSYEKAKEYLTEEVERRWKELLEPMI